MSGYDKQLTAVDLARTLMNKAAAGEAVTPEEAEKVARRLRDTRRFRQLTEFAEALRKAGVDTPRMRTFHAQGQLDLGEIDAALGMLSTAQMSISDDDGLSAEFCGLLGRGYKEQFLRVSDKSSDYARRVLCRAADHYRLASSFDPNWAVPNLMALNRVAERYLGSRVLGSEPEDRGRELLTRLDATPQSNRDRWFHATRAELRLGLGDIVGAAEEIAHYVQDPHTTSFQIAGTLRQYVQLWNLPATGAVGAGVVEALQASQFLKDYASLRLDESVSRVSGKADALEPRVLEALLGRDGIKTIEWLRNGVEVSRSIGAIRQVGGGKVGTGFIVRGGDFLPTLGNEPLLLTNSHVVSDGTIAYSLPFDECEVVFEEIDARRFPIIAVLWHSPVDMLDACLVRLADDGASRSAPVRLAPRLPVLTPPQRVYVIGYPGGDDLSISLDGNLLLDHEGPPHGMPPDPKLRRRLQYEAPTEPGSSGSPVFNASNWRVIGVHHAGGSEMPRLNGRSGSISANEGLWIQAVVECARGA
ncbi:serine protease [Mesorhizobium sp. CO1-1-2]|uniref:serine protease n=1 Tax=Mesorhizobium sp. CO1-1-2 TaxID=2876635 RepID=UPI001CCA8939|nr:serine protease [Mesorhizobium sp. CO1-1-2]MBZ9683333.1 serine protease [Mesorhizobium sp. CO1-1-2]